MTRRHAWAEDKVPWNTKLIDDTISPNINNYFCQIYNKFFKDYILVNPPIKAKDTPDLTNPLIYIGLKNHNNLFGDYVIKDTTINGAEFIDNTPYNRNCVNQFKLYIMSIIANYKTDGSTLHNLINEEISKGLKFDLQKVVEILGMRPIKPTPVIEAPVIAAPAKPPRPGAVLNSDNMTDEQIELYIYREFAVKCSLSHNECDTDYDAYYASENGRAASFMPDFIKLDALEKTKKTEKPIRNIYLNLSEYITGTEGLQVMTTTIDKIIAAFNSLWEYYSDKTKTTHFFITP